MSFCIRRKKIFRWSSSCIIAAIGLLVLLIPTVLYVLFHLFPEYDMVVYSRCKRCHQLDTWGGKISLAGYLNYSLILQRFETSWTPPLLFLPQGRSLGSDCALKVMKLYHIIGEQIGVMSMRLNPSLLLKMPRGGNSTLLIVDSVDMADGLTIQHFWNHARKETCQWY